MTDSTTAAITHSDPTTLSQFLYTHEKLRNLARGPLPSQIVDEMVHTVCGIAEKVLEAPAADWRELSKKALLMIEELPVDDPGSIGFVKASAGTSCACRRWKLLSRATWPVTGIVRGAGHFL